VPIAPSPTPTAGVVGHGFTLTSGAEDFVRLSWRAGTVESGLIVLRWSPEGGFGFLPNPTSPLRESETSFTEPGDVPTEPGRLAFAAYCYVPLVVGGSPPSINTVVGLGDFLCVYPHQETPNAPQNWSVRLDETRRAHLNWNGPGGQEHYVLTIMHFDNTPPETVVLDGGVTSYVEETLGRSSCYQLRAMNASGELGHTDTICAVPGVAFLPASGSAQEQQLRAQLEALPRIR
jgi:hypothetical protein